MGGHVFPRSHAFSPAPSHDSYRPSSCLSSERCVRRHPQPTYNKVYLSLRDITTCYGPTARGTNQSVDNPPFLLSALRAFSLLRSCKELTVFGRLL